MYGVAKITCFATIFLQPPYSMTRNRTHANRDALPRGTLIKDANFRERTTVEQLAMLFDSGFISF